MFHLQLNIITIIMHKNTLNFYFEQVGFCYFSFPTKVTEHLVIKLIIVVILMNLHLGLAVSDLY